MFDAVKAAKEFYPDDTQEVIATAQCRGFSACVTKTCRGDDTDLAIYVIGGLRSDLEAIKKVYEKRNSDMAFYLAPKECGAEENDEHCFFACDDEIIGLSSKCSEMASDFAEVIDIARYLNLLG